MSFKHYHQSDPAMFIHEIGDSSVHVNYHRLMHLLTRIYDFTTSTTSLVAVKSECQICKLFRVLVPLRELLERSSRDA